MKSLSEGKMEGRSQGWNGTYLSVSQYFDNHSIILSCLRIR